MAQAMMSAKDVANAIGCDPKTFRRFVRSYVRAKGLGDTLPGQGRRYAFDPDTLESIRSAFDSWRTIRHGVLVNAFDPVIDDDDASDS